MGISKLTTYYKTKDQLEDCEDDIDDKTGELMRVPLFYMDKWDKVKHQYANRQPQEEDQFRECFIYVAFVTTSQSEDLYWDPNDFQNQDYIVYEATTTSLNPVQLSTDHQNKVYPVKGPMKP